MHEASAMHDTWWVATAEMGYGHLRAAWPFRHRAHDGIIEAGSGTVATQHELQLWKRYLRLYEGLSRAKSIPVVGKPLYSLLDSVLHIPSLYPLRNLSKTTFQVQALYREMHRGLGAGVVSKISTEQKPLVSSFYVPALAAERAGHHPIFCIVCDADVHRVWVAKYPEESTINYFAPCGRAAMRLRSYGVSHDRIWLTGFPLDESLLGGRGLETLKKHLATRLRVLDPHDRFVTLHGKSVEHFLGGLPSQQEIHRPLTITYAVGGAGAQKETGIALVRSFEQQLQRGQIRIVLVAGTRADVRDYFLRSLQQLPECAANVHVVWAPRPAEYFHEFNQWISVTDILWTKPSELSFYVGLGLPLIMCPTIGPQEKMNRKWLLEIGAGTKQEKPAFASQWIDEWLKNGTFADMAWMGFLRARKLGYYHACDVIDHGNFERSNHPLLR
jgi:hypothetical protein